MRFPLKSSALLHAACSLIVALALGEDLLVEARSLGASERLMYGDRLVVQFACGHIVSILLTLFLWPCMLERHKKGQYLWTFLANFLSCINGHVCLLRIEHFHTSLYHGCSLLCSATCVAFNTIKLHLCYD